MTKRILLKYAWLACCLPQWAQAEQTIRIGVEGAYPPFSWMQVNGELTGFDIDIAHALCAQMQVRCELVQQDWSEIITALLSHKVDAIIASMDMTEERKRKVDFTDKYQQIPAQFAGKKASPFELSAAFMADKVIAVQRASSMDVYVSDNFSKATIKRFAMMDEAYQALKTGSVDYVLADSTAIMSGLLKPKGGEAFALLGPALTDKKWFGEGAGIAVRKSDKALKRRFNEAIHAIRANGQYQAINNKYFEVDIYGQ